MLQAPESRIRVLVISAYASVRIGLHALISGEPDLAVVGDLSGSDGLCEALEELHPDVLLYDHAGHDGVRVFEAAIGRLPILVLGPQDEARTWTLTAGFGWLGKSAEPAEIVAAIRAVVVGLVVLDGQALTSLLKDLGDIKQAQQYDAIRTDHLSVRETEVLQLMAEGLPNKVIAMRLGITPHTVKFHVTSILTKLGASSRTEAVSLGARQGFITF